MEDLEIENLEYKTVEEFLANLKKEFGGGDDKTMKVTELKEVGQWISLYKSSEGQL